MKITLTSTAFLLASLRPTAAFVAPPRGVAPSSRLFLFDKLFGTTSSSSQYPVYAEEAVMSQKAHGTSEKPVQKNLRWNCDYETADRSK